MAVHVDRVVPVQEQLSQPCPAVEMREREGTQTRCLATSVEKCLIMPPGSSAANIITIKEEEHEED